MSNNPNIYDVLIIGGGPAGMAAASTSARAGLHAVLVDERPSLGGQVYKQPGPGMEITHPKKMGRQYSQGRKLIEETEDSGTEVVLDTSVVSLEQSGQVWTAILHKDGRLVEPLLANRVIIASGASDRPVVFPGWDLPGVMTAGGLQTLAKTQAMVPGSRIAFAGSGPVALAFPAQLARYGANIVKALEAGPPPSLGDMAKVAFATIGNLSLVLDAVNYQAALFTHRIPLKYRRIIVRAEGDGKVERVVHSRVDREWQVIPNTEEIIDADILCTGYGFSPSVELMRLVGCEFNDVEDLGGSIVRKDTWCRTSVNGIYAAGDGAGVEGAAVAVDEGRLAGTAVAIDTGTLSQDAAVRTTASILRRIRRRRALTRASNRMYSVGAGIFDLAQPATTVCRCEGVNTQTLRRAIDMAPDVSAVKGLTRAGMGLCQGRMCGRHIASMIANHRNVPIADVAAATARMPIRPVPMSSIADPGVSDPGLFQAKAEPATAPEHLADSTASCRARPQEIQETDVIVVGGGIAGAAVAYYLAKEGINVTLLERGELNREASGTNAGSFHFQLAIHQLSGKGTAADEERLLGDARDSVRAYELWKGLSKELGADIGLHQTGGWMVAETAEQLQLLHEKHLLEQKAGIETEVFTGRRLRDAAPYFSDRVVGATFCDLEGHANPLIVAPLYAQRAAEAGAKIVTNCEVTRIDVNDNSAARRFTVHAPNATFAASRVVNCAAAWSGEVAEMVGLTFPIRAEGLHVNVTEARPQMLPSMVQHIGRRLTLKQTSHGSFIIGGGWPTGFATHPTRFPTQWQSASGNINVALDVIPELAEIRVVRTWSGVIAFTNDYSPVVGESEIVPGYFACISTTGFTFSPMFAKQLSEQILGTAKGGSPFPERFSLDRLSKLAPHG